MSVHTSTAPASTSTSASAVVALGLGLVAALLTTILSFVAIVAGVGALVAGVISWRRNGLAPRAAAGIAMATVSLYVIALEIFVTG